MGGWLLNKLAYFLWAVIVSTALIVLLFSLLAFVRETKNATETAPDSGKLIIVQEESLFIYEQGDPTQPTIVFIGGTGAWSKFWFDTLHPVAEAGFRVVAVDLPPFGFSARTENASYSREDQAKRILGLLQTLDLQNATIVCQSYGCGPSMEAVLSSSERIAAVVMVDPFLGVGQIPRDTLLKKITREVHRQPAIQYGLTAATVTNPFATRYLLEHFVFNKSAITEERIKIYQEPLQLSNTTQAVGDWLATMLTETTESLSMRERSYQEFELPVLLVWGQEDRITPVSQGEKLHGLLSKSQLKVIPEVGHIPHIEAVDQFNSVLLEFLKAEYATQSATEER